jgi:hypothetical protein
MANTGVIMSSAIGEHNRMDAGFHLLNTEHKERVAELKKVLTTSEALGVAREMFDGVPAQFRKLLEPLVRGSSVRNPDKAAFERTIDEYPYHTIAIFQSKQSEIETALAAQVAEAQASADKIKQRSQQIAALIDAKKGNDLG